MERLTIGGALEGLARGFRGGDSNHPPDHEIARRAQMSPATYSEISKKRDKEPRQSPSVPQLAALGRLFRTAPDRLFDWECDPFAIENDLGIRWRFVGRAAGAREQALRLAAAGVVFGESPAQIAERIRTLRRSVDPAARPPGEAEIRWMARGGLAAGLVEIDLSAQRAEIEDEKTASQLADVLEKLADTRPRVRVVRNVAHRDFVHDPAAPHLIAHVGHTLVSDFLVRHPSVFTIGIAGGIHVAAFVRSIGAATSPIPDAPGGDKRYTVVPLTLEPIYDHGLLLADALVGEMCSRTATLIGPDRVRAPSFHVFGYLEDRKIGSLKADALSYVRQHYEDLDLAIMGCGDRGDDGWIGHALPSLGLETEKGVRPETDVCLNLLSASGEWIELKKNGTSREQLGIGRGELERVVRDPRKLALLVASGRRKGLPLTLVSRAKMADTIVCDQAAAAAAMEVLG